MAHTFLHLDQETSHRIGLDIACGCRLSPGRCSFRRAVVRNGPCFPCRCAGKCRKAELRSHACCQNERLIFTISVDAFSHAVTPPYAKGSPSGCLFLCPDYSTAIRENPGNRKTLNIYPQNRNTFKYSVNFLHFSHFPVSYCIMPGPAEQSVFMSAY